METDADTTGLFGGNKDDKVNICEYVALNHSLLGMVFQKGKVRDQVALFGFVTSLAVATGMVTAEYVGIDDWKSQAASLALTLLVVTPATFCFKCFQGFFSGMKCLYEVRTRPRPPAARATSNRPRHGPDRSWPPSSSLAAPSTGLQPGRARPTQATRRSTASLLPG